MIKKFFAIFLVMFTFFCINNSVLAAPNVDATDSGTGSSSKTVERSESCPMFGDPESEGDLAYYMQTAFNIMKYVGILMLIGFTVMDLINGVTSGDDKEIQKIGTKFLKRFIYAVLLFFLPIIINFVFDILGLYGTCGIK